MLEAYSLEQSIQGSENDIDANKMACNDVRPRTENAKEKKMYKYMATQVRDFIPKSEAEVTLVKLHY